MGAKNQPLLLGLLQSTMQVLRMGLTPLGIFWIVILTLCS